MKKYRKNKIQKMRPYVPGEDLSGISVSEEDREDGSPRLGDMIAVSNMNESDKWLVSKSFFLENYELAEG
jgi:hypothetical protein